MTQRVLLIGQDPDTVDFSDPAIPPGFDAEKIRGGIALAGRMFAEQGIEMASCLIDPGETAEATIAAALAGKSYDCVVIGGGIRLPAGSLVLFERVINAVTRAAPGVRIAFNTTPPDSLVAAQRWLGR